MHFGLIRSFVSVLTVHSSSSLNDNSQKNRNNKKTTTFIPSPDLQKEQHPRNSCIMSNDNSSPNDTTQSQKQRWFPLESNPALMNEYVQKLGFDTSMFDFVDVFSTEDWALAMIPQPIVALILLYPLTDNQLKYQQQEEEEQTLADTASDVWFIKQRIGNACGTIGLLHTIFNIPQALQVFPPDSWLDTFRQNCPPALDPVAKAERLERDRTIATLHDQATSSTSNSTDRGNIDDDIITHFISFVHVNNQLYELDGRKKGPIAHGPTTPETLLQDAVRVVQEQFMKRDPEEMRFTMIALAPKSN